MRARGLVATASHRRSGPRWDGTSPPPSARRSARRRGARRSGAARPPLPSGVELESKSMYPCGEPTSSCSALHDGSDVVARDRKRSRRWMRWGCRSGWRPSIRRWGPLAHGVGRRSGRGPGGCRRGPVGARAAATHDRGRRAPGGRAGTGRSRDRTRRSSRPCRDRRSRRAAPGGPAIGTGTGPAAWGVARWPCPCRPVPDSVSNREAPGGAWGPRPCPIPGPPTVHWERLAHLYIVGGAWTIRPVTVIMQALHSPPGAHPHPAGVGR